MSIDDFVGHWKSSGMDTNPEIDIPSDPPSRNWPVRYQWYPEKNVLFEAKIVKKKIYHDYDRPKTTAREVDIIKFKIMDPLTMDPALVSAIETADFHYFGEEGHSGTLVSTPIRLDSTTWLVDTIEYLEERSLLPDGTPSPNAAMRHNLLWQDGLRTKWICCPDKDEDANNPKSRKGSESSVPGAPG